jgi:ribulose-5-phosphate 4-epimerase/fuculose-1-phosphate aldolase
VSNLFDASLHSINATLPEHFWINPLSKHFSQIRVSDLVLVDEKGRVLPGGAQYPINGPAFAIHSEIHKARPDINAACHAHSVYGKAFSCFGRPIEPLYQDAIRFYNDLSGMQSPYFDDEYINVELRLLICPSIQRLWRHCSFHRRRPSYSRGPWSKES